MRKLRDQTKPAIRNRNQSVRATVTARPTHGHASKHSRKALLLTTALTSTLLIGALMPAPAAAQQAVNIVASPAPVATNNAADCVFTGDCIFISTTGGANTIDLTNSGILQAATGGAPGDGIDTATDGDGASITITNTGSITAGVVGNTEIGIEATIVANISGIRSVTTGDGSGVTIVNSGDIFANNGLGNVGNDTGGLFKDDDMAILVRTSGPNSAVDITNNNRLEAGYDAINVVTTGGSSGITLVNRGNIFTGDLTDVVSDGGEAIDVRTYSGVASKEFLAGVDDYRSDGATGQQSGQYQKLWQHLLR